MKLPANLVIVLLAAAATAQESPPLRPGSTLQGEIADGDAVVATPALLTPDFADASALGRSVRLAIDAPGTYCVELRSFVFDAYLVLRGPDGRVLAENDDGLVATQSRIVFDVGPELPALTVEACALHGGRGPFELSLARGAPPALDPRQRDAAAVEDARQSVATRERLRGPGSLDVATALVNLGRLLRNRDELAEARSLFERALAIREQALGPEHPDVAYCLDDLASLLAEQGDFAGARSRFERAIAIAEKALGPEDANVGFTLHDFGSLLLTEGDPVAARPVFERSLAIIEKAYDPGSPEVARCLHGLASAELMLGDCTAARPLFERSQAIWERTLGSDDPEVGRSLDSQAQLLKKQGDYPGAQALAERALGIFERALGPDHTEVATTLGNLAGILTREGDIATARSLTERSLAILEKRMGPSSPEVAQGLVNLADILTIQHDYAGARALAERSLSIWENVLGPDHPAVARSLDELAMLLRLQGDAAAARPLLAKSLAIKERAFGPDHIELALTLDLQGDDLWEQGDHAGAMALFTRALAIKQRVLGPDASDVAVNFDNLAMRELEAGDASSAAVQLGLAERGFASGAARFLAGSSEFEAARYVASIRGHVELVQSPAACEARPVEAYASLLGWKGQILRAAQAGRTALRQRLGHDGGELAEHLHDVAAALSRGATDLAHGAPALASPQLEALVAERQRLERELAAQTAGLLPEVPSWPRLRDALPEDAALVDLFVHHVFELAPPDPASTIRPGHWTEPRVTAWVTRRGASQPVRVDLGPVAAIESAVRDVLDAIVGHRGLPLAAHVDPGDTLRRLVWDPLAAALDGAQTVIVSPDGVLGTVPFEVLRDVKGRYLVEDRGFVYLTDPTEVVRVADLPRVAGDSLLAVGGVDYDAREDDGRSDPATARVAQAAAPSVESPRGSWTDIWEPLAQTKSEALRVQARHAAAFPQSARQALLGADATEEQLKLLMPKHAIVHVATHSYFNPEGLPSLEASVLSEPDATEGSVSAPSLGDVAQRLQGLSPGLLSGLVCAGVNGGLPADRDDGYLTAEEVGWLDLSGVDLVVLSACDTGLGRPQSGEGLIGLRRSFLTAGARTVISSLWSVPDQETSELMDLFYANLWQKQMGKHAALRAAQLEMIRRNRERFGGDARPVTWGAFVLDGDWR